MKKDLLESHAPKLERLCEHCLVGVWQSAGQPDNLQQALELIRRGVRFVNTDLPSSFAPEEEEEQEEEDRSRPCSPTA